MREGRGNNPRGELMSDAICPVGLPGQIAARGGRGGENTIWQFWQVRLPDGPVLIQNVFSSPGAESKEDAALTGDGLSAKPRNKARRLHVSLIG